MAAEEPIDEQDPFYLQKIFPDATSIFLVKMKSLNEIEDDCLVVLDTNALLVPYTVSSASLNQINKTYSELAGKDRLFVPGQVSREFAKNRTVKYTDLIQKLNDAKSACKVPTFGKYPLLESFPDYKNLDKLEKEIKAKVEEYQRSLGTLVEEVKGWSWNDPVSEIYGKIFTSKQIIEAGIDDKELAKDRKDRYTFKRPPGYKDGGKDINSAGDLIIWHCILELAASRKKNVIFVSGDSKPDWWHQSGGNPIYPRFELIEEFRRRSEGQTLHIVTLSKFLELYGVDAKVVAEVRNEESIHSPNSAGYLVQSEYVAERSVMKRLLTSYPGIQEASLTRHDEPGDIVISHDGGSVLGVEVKIGGAFDTSFWRRTSKVLATMQDRYPQVMLCIIVYDVRYIAATARNARALTEFLRYNDIISIGSLDGQGDYQEQARYIGEEKI